MKVESYVKKSHLCNLRMLAVSLLAIPVLAACGRSGSALDIAPNVSVVTPEVMADDPVAVESSPESIQPTTEPSPTPLPTPFAVADGAAAVAYQLPLVVQTVSETTATLFFELVAPAQGVLLYGPAFDLGQSEIPLAGDTTRHQIVIEGLEPGIVYQAQILLEDADGQYRQPAYYAEMWGAIQFQTQAVDQPLRVGLIGDSGFGEPVTAQLAGEMAAADLDMAIVTGDVVYRVYDNADANEAFALKWFQPLAALLTRMPVYPVVGNHDVEPATHVDGVPYYYHAFPDFTGSAFDGKRQWYAVPFGDIQFLMLDSQTFFGEGGRSEQNDWLAERLADPNFRASIPAFHVAPYTSGRHPNDGRAIREQWHPLFAEANVPLVLNGHDHNYERLLVDGVTYIVSGGGSSVLYNLGIPREESVVFEQVNHYVILEISDSQISLQSIALGGTVIDEVVISLE